MKSWIARSAALLSLCIVLTWGVAVQAHHSFAMYDSAKLVSVVGTVKEFQWTNPHALLWIDAQIDGASELWTIELPTSPGNLARMGWSKRSLKPGDGVVVEINPLRDGKHGGSFKKVTIQATGQVLVASATLPDAGADAAGDDHDADAHDHDVAPAAKQPGGCACTVRGAPAGGGGRLALIACLIAAMVGVLRSLSRRASDESES